MSFIQKVIGAGLRWHVRRKARGMNLARAMVDLRTSFDEVVMPRMEQVADTPGNREAVNHWLGIERWSLSRVRVALGEPFVEGGYQPFRQPEGTSWEDLKEEFGRARQETLELAEVFERRGVDEEFTVRHNDLGPLTVLEWFVYIDDHSRREVIRLR